MGQTFAEKEASWGDFTVTPSVSGGAILFTVTDAAKLLTSAKMIRAVIMDALDQWLSTNAAQLVTNSVVIGNAAPADFGGSNTNRPPGDGGYKMNFNFSAKTAITPVITTTSLTTAALTASKPYADVV